MLLQVIPATSLRRCYALPDTHVAYGAARRMSGGWWPTDSEATKAMLAASCPLWPGATCLRTWCAISSTDRVAGTARGRVQASVYGARLLAVVEVQAAVRRKLCSGELVRTAASVLQTCVRRTVAPFNPKSWTLDPRP